MRATCSVVTLFYILAATAQAAIIVPDDHDTIGEAIAAASDGDTVLVRAGTYSGDGNVNLDFEGRNLSLIGIDGARCTAIDCGGTARAMLSHTGEDTTSVVRGFTFTGGSADEGGAIWCSGASPLIDACIFSASTASIGGALKLTESEAVIQSCLFSDNEATHHGGYLYGGGAIHCHSSSPVLRDCEFTGNSGHCGGAVYLTTESNARLMDCTFTSNEVMGYGGAVFCYLGSNAIVTRGVFTTNTAGYRGGAILTAECDSRITECVFDRNVAYTDYSSYGGGAICVDGGSPGIRYCEFTSNEAVRGGAVQCVDGASPWVRDCLFADNSASRGAGLYCREGSAPGVEDCHFEGGLSVSGAGVFSHSSSPQLRRCTFVGNEATGQELVQGGGAVFAYAGDPLIVGCTFAQDVALYGGAVLLSDVSLASVSRVTVADCVGSQGAAFFIANSGLKLANVIISECDGPAAGAVTPMTVTAKCTDIWGSTGGDWVGPLADLLGVSGNISEDPLFCGDINPETPYTLHGDSPCAPESDPDCGRMGAWDVGCAPTTGVQELLQDASWGTIKHLFR